MKKYSLPFILLSIVGLFVFALTNRDAKYDVGDCVIIAGARSDSDTDSFVHIIAKDRMQYQIKEYFLKKGVWKASQVKYYAKAHLDQTSYKDTCKEDIISSLEPKL